MTRYVEVAVPLPLPEPLTYSVPEGLRALARPGCRVRVRVGKRRLIGTIVLQLDEAPATPTSSWREGWRA